MKIVFFTFYYPPDLCAGSFRSIALVKALAKKLDTNDELHVIASHPNRYANHQIEVDDVELDDKVTIHRISVPSHNSKMVSQVYTFSVFAFSAFRLSIKLKPDFLIGTTSRLMTGILTSLSARFQNRNYFIDLRDIFSETISDLISRKSRILGDTIKPIFTYLEKKVLNGATGVNIVSEGFSEYFQAVGVDTSNWSFFPNGVDKEFMNFPPVLRGVKGRMITILYAGNIGSGQGLESVIPKAAKTLGKNYHFIVIGGGSTLSLLRNAINNEGVNNVELIPPLDRSKLFKYYLEADILFLHLNNIPAFRRVLPSKIFEYVALGRPIVAGLSGYSADFLKNNVPSAHLFNPGDYKGAVSSFKDILELEVSGDIISKFVKTYSRTVIMDKMANHLIELIE
ncbi:glycosyltransferase family 4 protein [Candidatus Pseudothioglobus singularis]|nr:glycosyltransferase family 4 protein [Candidatus Pseudothioglobus singularis]